MGGKKRHSKDRLFITTTEHKYEWGGKKDDVKVPISKLPFFCCSLSLLPFENPVCSPDGIVFDIINIVPYIKKYKRNPVTAQPLKITDLVKLNFHKNQKGEYHDPISFKIFTDFTHIVAVKTSGNVYGYDTVEELNRKAKNWHDLLTNEAFTIKDIITLQDPINLEKRTVMNFDYIKNNLNAAGGDDKNSSNQFINQNQTSKRIFEELEKNKNNEEFKENPIKKLKLDHIPDPKKVDFQTEKDQNTTNFFVQEAIKTQEYRHEVFTTADVASSFTSTNIDPGNSNDFRALTEKEIRNLYHFKVKTHHKKGIVQIQTNFGNLDVRLDSDLVPRTCENFIELCEKKYYNNTIFHRLVHNFCLQGGDPTGKGTGGESIYGKKFEDEFHPKLSHEKAGKLSMANSGKNTNGSQFFITLGECKYLDNKHTVFGEVVGGMALVDKINTWRTSNQSKPDPEIKINQTIVIENPFREAIREIKEVKEKKNEKPKKSEFWLTKEAEGFRLPEAKPANKNKEDLSLTKFFLESNQLQEKAQSIADQKLKKKNKEQH